MNLHTREITGETLESGDYLAENRVYCQDARAFLAAIQPESVALSF